MHTEIANILTESFPYIQKFYGQTIVIKYGGNAMTSESLKNAFAKDIILLKLIGINPVIIHGGGPQIQLYLDKLGIVNRFINGLRVTNHETMEVVSMVLGGLINQSIVSLINQQGGHAIGINGQDDRLIVAKKISNDASDDLGLVGEVSEINTSLIQSLTQQNLIPIIAPIGVDNQGQPLNINADTVASSIAQALQAKKLILLSNTSGILDENKQTISNLTIPEVNSLIQNGTIHSGMIPKVQGAISALNNNVNDIHLIDGRIKNALLLELFTDNGIGTKISS